MSDGGLEGFIGSEASEGIDAAALERLREHYRQAQQQQAQDQKREAKQKQQEDNVGDIIKALLKNQNSRGLLNVVTKALAANIPAYFILAVLALRFETVRSKIGLDFSATGDTNDAQQNGSKSLVPSNFSEQVLPLKIKIEIDIWLKFVISESQKQPQKVLDRIREGIAGSGQEKQANNAIKNLVSYIIQDYLQSNQQDFIGSNIVAFSHNFCDSLVDYLVDYISRQKQIT